MNKWTLLLGAVALGSVTPAIATKVLITASGTILQGFDTGVFGSYPNPSPVDEAVVLSFMVDTNKPGADIEHLQPNWVEVQDGIVSAKLDFRGLSYIFGDEQNGSRVVKLNDEDYGDTRDGMFVIADFGVTHVGPLGNVFDARGQFQFQGAFATSDVFQTAVFDEGSFTAPGQMTSNIVILGSANNPGTFDVFARLTSFSFTICGGHNDPCAAAPPVPGGGVPEPASWAMMIAGLGAAGGLLRRARQSNSRVVFV